MVLAFLQDWRAALIPLVAVPVAIVGTFAVMAALGFSLNNLSLFGLVLAIGIVVDDAIVVVENVERWLEQGLAPAEAARRAMDEVTGPVVAVALVLCAVFVPCAFIGGITGQFFRQFAVTIAISTVISAFNSLTLSPALAALLLRPHSAPKDRLTRLLDLLLGWFFRLFNRAFAAGTGLYAGLVGLLLRVTVACVGRVWRVAGPDLLGVQPVPRGFIPAAGQGLPAPERPAARLGLGGADVEGDGPNRGGGEEDARVAHTLGVSGLSVIQGVNAPNIGSMYVMLREFPERRGPGMTADASPTRSASDAGRRFGRRSSRPSARPRSKGWAPPAASR